MSLEIGSPAPSIALKDQNGDEHRVSDHAGSPVLVYFYPKDDTPGCTKEACGLRDSWKDLADHGCKVFGVSRDSTASHKKFADKYDLPFTLLSDPDKELIEACGAWQEKSMYGKKYMGIARMSVLFDAKGKVAKIYPKVKPADHAAEVLADLKELS